MKRIEVLDVFRGFAALGVVFFHYSRFFRTINESNDGYFSLGYFGVMFFFMISGFVIFLTLKQSKSPSNFLFRRFSRLYPTFWFCLLLTSLCVRIFGLPGREVSWKDMVLNITMIPQCFKAKDVDGAYWSLIYEFFFYLFMAFLMWTKALKVLLIWIVPWLFLCLLRQFTTVLSGAATWIFNLNYGTYFIAGIMFYQLKFVNSKNLFFHVIIICSLLISCIGLKSIVEVILVVAFYGIFYLFVFEKLDFLAFKSLTYLGRISFPLYLVHQNTGYIQLNFLHKLNPQLPMAIILVPVITSLCLAGFIHRFVEKPSIRWFRRYFEIADNKKIPVPVT